MTVEFDDGTQISIAPGHVSPMGIDMIVSWGTTRTTRPWGSSGSQTPKLASSTPETDPEPDP